MVCGGVMLCGDVMSVVLSCVWCYGVWCCGVMVC